MSKRLVYMLLSGILLYTPNLLAEDALPSFNKEAYISSAEERRVLNIGMVDCVLMAFKNNSEILVKKIDPLIAESNIKIQKAVFEPDVSFDYSMENDIEQSSMGLISNNPSKTRTNIFNIGYTQKLVTGTDVEFNFYNTRTGTNSPIQGINPAFDSEAEISITQPLLKGFGVIVNKADLLIAKNNKLISDQDFISEVINVLTNVKESYYNFQYTQEQYIVAKTSLERVENLHYINKEKYAKGLASNIDILESESEVARFKQALLEAERQMKQAEDSLKLITNLIDDEALWNANIVLLDTVSYEKKDVAVIDSILEAFNHRPDYESAKIDLKNKDLSIIFNKNGLLPTLDLIGSFGLNGLDKNYGKDLRHMGGGKYPDWVIGASVNIPLGNDDAKGKYEKSKYAKEQALISFARLEQKIVLDVRDKVRDVLIKYDMVEASKITKEAEAKNFEAQEARFKAGLVSTLDILIYQERLARAEVGYVKSVIDYNTSLIELSKAKGTTLLESNIKIQ